MSPQNSGADYLQQVYDALARSGRGSNMPFDAIGQHPYVDQAGHADPDHIRQYLDDVEQVVRRNEGRPDGRMIFVTETGWSTTAVSPEVQAANLHTLFATCSQYPPVAAVCWFQVRDNPAANLHFGVYTSNWAPKPAATAFQHAQA